MAYFFSEPSRTFSEYLLVPGYSSAECIPANVSLKTPVVKYRRGEEPALTMNVPMVSAVMQAVSGEQMGIALAKEGGIAFIYVSQPIEQQAEMVRRVKNYKAGFVISDSNLRLGDTLADVLALKERTGHSTMAVTDDGTGTGKLLGLVTSRDYRVSRMDPATPVSEFMTPAEKIVSAPEGTSLKAANDIIWDHKLNALPIVSAGGHLVSFVFRKDYDSHKGNPLELLDSQKRYVVGAGINSRDYEERVPALVEAGADVLVIDSSEGYSEWQKRTLAWIRSRYGDTVKVGAGNVVDGEGFRFLADCGADFVKVNPPKPEDGSAPAEALKVAAMASGRTGLVCAGGSTVDAETFLTQLYDQIHIGGACGNATGRNIHQRSLAEAVRLTKAISAITLADYSVEDALDVFNGDEDFSL